MNKDFYNSHLGKMQMHFHTSIRNVGLYLSIATALLGGARYYRKGAERSRFKQLLFYILSFTFATNSFLISKYILHDHMLVYKKMSNDEKKYVLKWYTILRLLILTSSLFLLYIIYLSLNTSKKIIKQYI